MSPTKTNGPDVHHRSASHANAITVASHYASFASYKAPRVHHAARRRGCCVAARGARAAPTRGSTDSRTDVEPRARLTWL